MTNDDLDLIHPIGSIYETLDTSFNPNESWGGSWSADNTESVLVSQNSNDLFSASLGTIVGANTAITNLPNHTHSTSAAVEANGSVSWFSFNAAGDYAGYGPGSWTAAAVGGGGSHENRMRSKYVVRWIRYA